MSDVYLIVPSKDDLHYRQEWLTDLETMSYNAGLDLDIKGYDKTNGTITMTDEEMLEWYDKWIGKEPNRFYAYIHVVGIDEPIGEVYYYPEDGIHSVGILINSKYRGKGYSYPALKEIEKIAFVKNKINELSDMVPLDRTGAINVFKKAGFVHTEKEITEKAFDKDSIVKQLIITRDSYFGKKKSKISIDKKINENPNNKNKYELLMGILLIIPIYMIIPAIIRLLNISLPDSDWYLPIMMYIPILCGMLLAYKTQDEKFNKKLGITITITILIAIIFYYNTYFVEYEDWAGIGHYYMWLLSTVLCRLISCIFYGKIVGKKEALKFLFIYILTIVASLFLGVWA